MLHHDGSMLQCHLMRLNSPGAIFASHGHSRKLCCKYERSDPFANPTMAFGNNLSCTTRWARHAMWTKHLAIRNGSTSVRSSSAELVVKHQRPRRLGLKTNTPLPLQALPNSSFDVESAGKRQNANCIVSFAKMHQTNPSYFTVFDRPQGPERNLGNFTGPSFGWIIRWLRSLLPRPTILDAT